MSQHLPKNPLRIATAQFENRSGNKAYNLERIAFLARQAKNSGAQVVAFHECSVTGLTFVRTVTGGELFEIAEAIPDGPSVSKLQEIAGDIGIVILAGLFERGADGKIYKTQVCVDGNGLIASFRKIHPFMHPAIQSGNEYMVFDLFGWKCGILICFDNNVIENVRATRLLGAQVLFAPHVTMGTPGTRPGAGFFDQALWETRDKDPAAIRTEFDSMKGRGWLMRWLPARAYDNAMYVVFSNPIGMDHDQLKNGCSMVLDPFGGISAECRSLGDEVTTATLTPEPLKLAGGLRYLNSRKPELYGEIIGRAHTSKLVVDWVEMEKKSRQPA